LFYLCVVFTRKAIFILLQAIFSPKCGISKENSIAIASTSSIFPGAVGGESGLIAKVRLAFSLQLITFEMNIRLSANHGYGVSLYPW